MLFAVTAVTADRRLLRTVAGRNRANPRWLQTRSSIAGTVYVVAHITYCGGTYFAAYGGMYIAVALDGYFTLTALCAHTLGSGQTGIALAGIALIALQPGNGVVIRRLLLSVAWS